MTNSGYNVYRIQRFNFFWRIFKCYKSVPFLIFRIFRVDKKSFEAKGSPFGFFGANLIQRKPDITNSKFTEVLLKTLFCNFAISVTVLKGFVN